MPVRPPSESTSGLPEAVTALFFAAMLVGLALYLIYLTLFPSLTPTL
jgi:hypothetical protein